MFPAVKELLDILDLEQIDVNLFRGLSPQDGRIPVFGGQIVSQALVAACRTVNGRTAHSMHANFFLPGDPAAPILYEVERIRGGRSLTARRVKAMQQGQPIFSMMVSFHNEETGSFEHQSAMPDVPMPDDLPDADEVRERILPAMPELIRTYYARKQAIELRPVTFERYQGRKFPDSHFSLWLRASGRLPEDPAVHQFVLAYASDMTLLDTALVPHGRTLFENEFIVATLNHAVWLHRPFRADEWLLYAQDSPSLHGSRGVARGLIFTRDGTLVASVIQEGLLRQNSDAAYRRVAAKVTVPIAASPGNSSREQPCSAAATR